MASDPSSHPDQPLPVAEHVALTDREKAALSKAVGVHTISQVTQIWTHRLHLTSIYASFFTTIDSLLFTQVSHRKHGGLVSKLALSSLAGALIFHSATAALAYVGSLVLVRYKLNDAQATLGNPSPRAVAIAADAGSADPHISEPIVATSSQTPSALGPGDVRLAEAVEHGAASSAHPPLMPTDRIFSTTSTCARSSLLSDVTDALAALLHHPADLYIDMRRESLFNLRAMMPCVGAPVDDADSNHDDDDDAQKNAIALSLLLNKCHDVCSCFAFLGFVLVVTGVVACLWEVLESSVAIFGSVCVAVCLVLSFGALC